MKGVRAALPPLAIVLLLSGCLGSQATEPKAALPASPVSLLPPDVEALLTNVSHLKVAGAATLKWDLKNGTKDKPEVSATVLYLAEAFKASHLGVEGSPALVALIPFAAAREASTCGPPSSGVKSYFRGRDAGTNDRFKNVSGTYEAGLYHAIVVADAEGSFTITLGSEKELKARTLPGRDPYVDGATVTLTGAREFTHPVQVKGDAWFAWATHRLPQNGVDGGRQHSVSVGTDCVQQARTSSSATIGNPRTITAVAAGTVASFEIKGRYAPTLAAAAPASTTLEAAWVWVKPVASPRPEPSPSPSG